MSKTSATNGWTAIDRVFKTLYPKQEPQHWGTLLRWCLGGNDPLDGISAYLATEPVPHWHFVSYGLSELYEKESENKDWSGWGFEFTFRLARKKNEKSPSMWALGFLQNLARYVFQTGNTFAEYHHIDLNGPIALESDTKIRAVLFLRDQQTEPLSTLNGKLNFLQIVGITLDELEAVMLWDCEKVLKLLVKKYPRLVTDLDRDSILDDPAIRKKVAAGIARDGSSVGDIAVGEGVTWIANKRKKPIAVELTISTLVLSRLRYLLPGRTLFDREFQLSGKAQNVRFVLGKSVSCEVSDNTLIVTLTREVAEEMHDTFQDNDQPGEHCWPSFPNFIVKVEQSIIKDSTGKVVRKGRTA
jgi:suppressor of fused